MIVLLLGTYKNDNNNEYIRLLADAYSKDGHEVIFGEQNFMFSTFAPDILHIQWPEAIYRWHKLVDMNENGFENVRKKLKWYKKNRTKIVYTAHNIIPHDNTDSFDERIYSLIMSYADIIVHHGKSSIAMIEEKYPLSKTKRHIVSPHGPYDREEMPLKEVTRDNYNLPQNKAVFTSFGLQRAYKGYNFSCEVFKKWGNLEALFFSIGKIIYPKNPFNIDEKSPFCMQIDKRVTSNEIPEIMALTDVFFLGHLSGLNSGAISLALTYEKPIVFPDIGNFKEQVKGWKMYETYEVGNIDSAIDALSRIQAKKRLNKRLSNKEWLQKNSWEIHIRNIISAILNES